MKTLKQVYNNKIQKYEQSQFKQALRTHISTQKAYKLKKQLTQLNRQKKSGLWTDTLEAKRKAISVKIREYKKHYKLVLDKWSPSDVAIAADLVVSGEITSAQLQRLSPIFAGQVLAELIKHMNKEIMKEFYLKTYIYLAAVTGASQQMTNVINIFKEFSDPDWAAADWFDEELTKARQAVKFKKDIALVLNQTQYQKLYSASEQLIVKARDYSKTLTKASKDLEKRINHIQDFTGNLEEKEGHIESYPLGSRFPDFFEQCATDDYFDTLANLYAAAIEDMSQFIDTTHMQELLDKYSTIIQELGGTDGKNQNQK